MSEQAVSADVGNVLVTRFSVEKCDAGEAGGWLVKSLMLGSEFPGFTSGEIIPPLCPSENEWTLLQRFAGAAEATAWKQSEKRARFLAELQAAHAHEGLRVIEEDRVSEASTVTTAITTHVRAGMESAYREWEGKVQTAQASFPGFRGSYFQPDTGATGVWVSLLRFDGPGSLDRWFESPQRQKLLNDVKQLVTSTDIQRITGSFPGWVPIDANTGKGPPNWKTFLLVLLGLYPIVTLEIRFLMPLLAHIPSAPANLLANSLSVAATTWLTMPVFIKWFAPWLFPSEDAKPSDHFKWPAIIVACFIAEMAILWHLL